MSPKLIAFLVALALGLYFFFHGMFFFAAIFLGIAILIPGA